MKRILFAGAVAAVAVASPASAQGQGDWAFSGNVSVVSDYRFRGISQTFKLPAIQGGFDLGHSAGFYVGTWLSNVSGNQYPGGNSMEWDLYGGYKFSLANGVSLDAGLLQYYYPGAKVPGSLDKFDTTEAYLGATLGYFNAKLSLALTDFFGVPDSSGSWYAEVNANYPITKTINLVGHIGHQDVDGAGQLDYTDWKLGATTDLAGLTWGLAYIGTNADDTVYVAASASDGRVKKIGGDTIVLSVGKTF
jgi:uncharacterized protein (TIGR02001 family)